MPWNQNLNLNIKIERDAHGYFADCAELEGTQVQGDSLPDLLSNLAAGIISSLQRQSENVSTFNEDAEYQTSTQARAALLSAGFIVLRKDSIMETLVGSRATINLPIKADKVLHPKLVALVRQAIEDNLKK